ncbi:MAG: homoserine kinase [Actinomycetota bacterium]|nr:homoserine kinase [Actinomycetota bacterium]
MRLTVRVPATSANLGPGYDSFGLALDLCNEVTVDTDAEPGVTWEGEGSEELPTDGTDMISRAMAFVAAHASFAGSSSALPLVRLPLPPVRLHGKNRIPLERGLGSSSAAAVAGVMLAHRVLDLADPDAHTIFRLAAEFEGHPDNAAPAVFGGFTIALGNSAVQRLDTHPDVRPVLLIPELRLATSTAREVLPATVPMHAAVSNIAHAALAVVALTRDPSLLATALVDRIHQPYRLPLVPAVREVFDDLVAEGIPVCVSGAGPTLLAFDRPDRSVPDPGPGWRTLRPALRAAGAGFVEA